MVELLVSATIGMLMVTVGIAGYLSFNERQKVIGSAREFESMIQLAQIKAAGGDLGTCTILDAYQMTFNLVTNPVTVTLSTVCAPSGTTAVVKTLTLGSGVTLSFNPSVTSIKFPVLQGTVQFTPSATSVNTTFGSTALTESYVQAITRGGEISEGAWQ